MKTKTAHLTAPPGCASTPARTEPKLTPWFPPGVKPARPGVYISTVDRLETFYRYWDGETWHYGGFYIREATRDKPIWATGSWLHWRGLASNPARSGNK